MKRIVRLTESDLARIVRRVIKEEEGPKEDLIGCFNNSGITPPNSCNTGDVTKCMEDLADMVKTDPLEFGLKVGQILTCITTKLGNSGGSNRIKVPGYGGGHF